jgi:branched-chain amino acid transport system permease protein
MGFVQQLINGLALGSVYALIAIGYTMVYGIIGLINFAHGDIYMVAFFLGFYVINTFHLPLVPALLITMVGCGLLGVIIEKVAYKPLRNSTKIVLLITAIAMSLILENGFAYLFTPDPRSFPQDKVLTNVIYRIGSLEIKNTQLLIFGVSVLLVIILQFLVFKTRIGKAMRASSHDMDAAKLMGINVDNVISFTFAIGSALAGAAGFLTALLYNSFDPFVGIMPGLKAFVAAVLGGIGVLPGAMVGGLVLGLAETLTKAYISTSYSDAIAFAILIVVLLIKPSGLFGKKSNVKV